MGTAVYLIFGPFLVQKQCILLFSNLYLAAYDYLVCTSKVKLLLATSFIYPLLVGAVKNGFIFYFTLAANLHHFGTENSALDFFGNL
jgi:hypothetical protein